MPSSAATSPVFLAVPGQARSRVFLLAAEESGPGVALEQVATVAGPSSRCELLVERLNDALWGADRLDVEEALAGLPDAVAVACRQALDRAAVAKEEGSDGERQVVKKYFAGSADQMADEMRCAITLGLQFLVTNEDQDGTIEINAALYAEDVEVPYSSAPHWLPAPEGAALLERIYPREDQLESVLSDPRWETFESRAYWLWVQDEVEPDSADAQVVVEHFDRVINQSDTLAEFVVEDDGDPETRGPLTPRNRYDLYVALAAIMFDLDLLLQDWDGVESIVRGDVPLTARNQPREWWAKMQDSACRLAEAARTGALDDLEPRTVAEEVLISLATRPDYVEWGLETAPTASTTWASYMLPRDDVWDGQHREILPHLVGDGDVEMLWNRGLDGIDDPSDPTNLFLRIGDYRAKSWHEPFDAVAGTGPDAGGTSE